MDIILYSLEAHCCLIPFGSLMYNKPSQNTSFDFITLFCILHESKWNEDRFTGLRFTVACLRVCSRMCTHELSGLGSGPFVIRCCLIYLVRITDLAVKIGIDRVFESTL